MISSMLVSFVYTEEMRPTREDSPRLIMTSEYCLPDTGVPSPGAPGPNETFFVFVFWAEKRVTRFLALGV